MSASDPLLKDEWWWMGKQLTSLIPASGVSHSVSARVNVLALCFLLSLLLAAPTQAGFLGIEFDVDDCINKYIEKMRWAKQRRLMKDICQVKHESASSRTEKRFAQCVLDSIFEVSDDSNGRRVLQSCSSKTGEEAAYRRLVTRFPIQRDISEMLNQQQSNQRKPQAHQPITIIDQNGKPISCIRIGEVIHCP
ncbi:MAG: hypothetical protein ACREUB_12110 [Burkholderiales bacterium]